MARYSSEAIESKATEPPTCPTSEVFRTSFSQSNKEVTVTKMTNPLEELGE